MRSTLSTPKATLFLNFLWTQVGNQVNTPDGAAAVELAVLGADFKAGWQVIVIKMPQPRAVAGQGLGAE